MFKVVYRHFFRGANIAAPYPGLHLRLRDDGADTGLAWRPEPAALLTVLRALHAAFPVVADSHELASTRHVCSAPSPLLALMLATAEVLLRDLSPRPRHGHVVKLSPPLAVVFVPCPEEESGIAVWDAVTAFADSIPTLNGPDAAACVQRLSGIYSNARAAARIHAANQSVLAMVRAAARRGIPHYRLGERSQYAQLGQGCKGKRIFETQTDGTTPVARSLSNDKLITSMLLASQGLPTPGTVHVTSFEEALQVAQRIGWPVVVKPRASGKGKGVTVDIHDAEHLRVAVANANTIDRGLIIERHVPGDDHRLLVVGGRFVAAAMRIPGLVVGDGKRTVRQLLDALNRDPRRGIGFERVLQRIDFDDEARHCLAKAGLDEHHVPAPGTQVLLRGVGNLSRGGSSIDVTHTIHPDNRVLAERAAILVGLDVAGIDFQTPDITRSWRSTPSAVLEVNSTPGLRPHYAANPDHDVADAIVANMFPDAADGRIPTVGITGSLGKTTTCRLVAAVLASTGRTVGLCTTQGAWIGSTQMGVGDMAGGRSAAALLTDPGIDAGVFEFARGGLLRGGMLLDAVDVGAVLNVDDNHLGVDGVETREQLAQIKRLVAQAARHAVVLNADDPLCLAMREHLKAPRVVLVSTDADNPELLAHLRSGGHAASLDASGTLLQLHEGMQVRATLAVADVPTTWQGRYRPALSHALFAMAITTAMGVDFSAVAAVLRDFQCTAQTNPGRMNVHENLPYTLVASHADGPRAMRELAHFVRAFDAPRGKTVLLCSAGDRPDAFIRDIAASVAGAFTRYVCSDWFPLRGREPGVVAGLLAHRLRELGVPHAQIVVAASLQEAVPLAYDQLAAGDLIADNSYSDGKREAWLRERGVAC